MKYFTLTLLFLLLVGGCQNPAGKTKGKQITVSILPLKYFAESITGKTCTVNVLVPPGQSAENFEPTPGQLQQLSDSKLYFSIGHFGFEQQLNQKITSFNKDLRLINVSENLPLIHSEDCHHEEHSHATNTDPHTWLSAKNGEIIAKNIYNSLLNAFPEEQKTYEANYLKLISAIEKLDSTTSSLLKDCRTKDFLIYHPALGYFARDYGLTQHSMEADGKEPTPNNLKSLIDLAKKEDIHTIFIQKEFDSKYASMLATEINGKIVSVDALSPDWLKVMTKLSVDMKQALK